MDKKVIEEIQARMTLDEDRQKDFAAYDDMDAVKFDFEGMLEPWMVARVATDAHDALKVLDNIFETHNPKVNVVPFGDGDMESAERVERWVEYQFGRINARAGESPLRKLSHYAGKYGRVAFQVDYLPYWLDKDREKWTQEQKETARAGVFCVVVHNPRNVFYSMGKYGLRWCASVTVQSSEQVIEHWGAYEDDDKDVKKALAKVRAMYEDNEELTFIHVDYMDYEKRQVSLFKSSGAGLSDFEDYDPESTADDMRIDVFDKKNKLEFLNWVVVECDTSPLLEGLHRGGLYKYKTLYDTVKNSTIMRRAYPPLTVQTTIDGKPLNVDYTGGEAQVVKRQGEMVEPFIPPPLDPAIRELSAEVDAQVEQALGVKKLASITGSNMQYSTVNAIIDLHMTNLEPYKRTSEKAHAQAAMLMLRWVEYTQDTVTGYRTKKTKPDHVIGEEILLSPGDLVAEEIILTVALTTKSDKIQAANRASMIKQAGFRVPDTELLEELGYSNPEVLGTAWEDEQLKNTALQMLIKQLQAQQDLQTQAQQMQMQMGMEQAQMQQQMQAQAQQPQDPSMMGGYGQMANPEAGHPSAPQGQGFNGNAGGTPPMMAEPGMTSGQVGAGA